MANDPSLVYQPGREYGTRHLVFRRTNLPCLRCGEKIRQLRQKTIQNQEDEEERTRIVYFCAKCQRVATRIYADETRIRVGPVEWKRSYCPSSSGLLTRVSSRCRLKDNDKDAGCSQSSVQSIRLNE